MTARKKPARREPPDEEPEELSEELEEAEDTPNVEETPAPQPRDARSGDTTRPTA